MAEMKYNPPPNWPPPPEGWSPEPGWQPDASWGPAPHGWPLWVEAAPVRTKKKAGHLGRNIILAGVALLIVAVVWGVIDNNNAAKKPAAATSSGTQTAATTTPTPTHAASAVAKTTTAVKPAGPLFAQKGNGIKTTKPFKVTAAQFTVHYRYSCKAFGSSGNFQVYVFRGSDMQDIAVNELGKSGADTTEEYGDPGSYHLEVNSECSWSISVTQ